MSNEYTFRGQAPTSAFPRQARIDSTSASDRETPSSDEASMSWTNAAEASQVVVLGRQNIGDEFISLFEFPPQTQNSDLVFAELSAERVVLDLRVDLPHVEVGLVKQIQRLRVGDVLG
eukprot:CAMPEP_0170499214 /NCGR_PEP_ID=MMETSP0208-20121228/30551_1 /TAXON_ID=197538 /ORGANISM="Strombidium inclinatum, Strain S3" /LENGTH=117 /DNA_ID=CAMNT_0010776681 /DNA_START=1572 /DNA_END=1922 /DNA_ORIENTATION=+